MWIPDPAGLRRMVGLACRAPSVHNSQPWRWVATPTGLELHADLSRQLVATDPDRRDLFISCGAALHGLTVAAAAEGWLAKVRRLPDPEDPRLLAIIEFSPRAAEPEDEIAAAALRVRHTDRRRSSSWPVTIGRLESLAEQGRRYGAHVAPIDDEFLRARLEALLDRADAEQHWSPRYIDELAGWTDSTRADGIPSSSVPARSADDGPRTRFPSGTLIDQATEPGPAADGMLLVASSSDDGLSRLRAGEALGAILLQATTVGLVTVPLSQAVEVERTRRELAQHLLDDHACPQMLVRVGWPPIQREVLPRTRRRPMDDVLSWEA